MFFLLPETHKISGTDLRGRVHKRSSSVRKKFKCNTQMGEQKQSYGYYVKKC
ncbi:unnamed protein product [Amoebophrya sp. A25]|nr:unnamed protein product [Amoebophrya sp. A25]|eukprot:GSA25T00027920001.1